MWLQEYAENYVKRKLTDKELNAVKKCIEYGLLNDIGAIHESAIDTAIPH